MKQETKMLPVRQKRITEAIKKAGFRLSEFDFTPLSNELYNLKFKEIPDFFFQRNQPPSSEFYVYKPSKGGKERERFRNTGFESLLENLNKWLEAIKENLEVGDPWHELSFETENKSGIEFDTFSEYFTENDILILSQKLNQLLLDLNNQKIITTEIQEDIKFLIDKLTGVSKKEWALLFMGSVLSWAVNNLIPSDLIPRVIEFVLNHPLVKLIP